MSDFASFAEGVAVLLWGEPNKHLSNSRELRFGNNGSKSVDLTKGVWSDHAETPGSPEAGGGVLDMVCVSLGVSKGAAIEWLRNHGFPVEDRPVGSRRESARSEPRPRPKSEPKPKDEAKPKASGPKPKKTIVATYDYRDSDDRLVYQVVRYEPKTFSQRRPAPREDGVWCWGLDAGEYMRRGPGQDWFRFDEERFKDWNCKERMTLEEPVEHGLYMRPDLDQELASGALIFLPEGEKDVETLRKLGAPATTNSGGAKHWRPELAAIFAGASVVLPIDNDKPGRERGEILARSLSEAGAFVKLLDVSHHWAGCPEKGDISDWILDGGLGLERLYELVEALPDWTPEISAESAELAGDPDDPGPLEEYVPRFNLVMWEDLDRAVEKHEWLIKGLITRGEMVLLPGASGSGKTFAWLDAAMAVARGVDFLGHKTRRGGVVYQAGEGYKGLKSKRLVAYRRRHGLEKGERLPFAVIGSPIDLFSDDADMKAMIGDIKFAASHWDCALELVIIDTFSAATPGANENTSEDISKVLKRCEKIRAATGAAVLLVHHMNATGEKARGHTSLGANVDSVIICRKVEGMHDVNGRMIRELEVKKQKDGEDGLRLRFVLNSIEIDRDEDGEAVTSCTVSPPQGNVVGQEEGSAPAKLSAQAYNFLRSIEKATTDHGVSAAVAAVSSIPADVKVVEFSFVRDAFSAASFEDDDREPAKRAAAIRQAIKRQGETLLARGFIGRHERFLWRTDKPLPRSTSETSASSASSGPEWTPPENLADDPGWTEVL